MRKVILLPLSISVCLLPALSKAGTFTSNGTGGGTWSSSASWTFSGDADGIPDSDDNVTILSGDAVTWNTSSSVNNLTVNAGGTLTSSGGAIQTLIVLGNFTLNGTETGSGTYEFRAPGTSISGSGTHSASSRWVFSGSRTIAANVVATKSFYVRLYGSSTVVTNLGNLYLYCVSCQTSGARWVQGTNSTLKVKTLPVMNGPVAGGFFDAGTNVNTVELDYLSANQVPPSVSNTYYNLRISDGSRQASTSGNLVVRNSLYIGLNSTFHCNHNLTMGGSFAQFGSYGNFNQASGSVLTFNGTTTQTVSSQVSLSFQNLVMNKPSGSLTFSSARVYNVLQSLSLLSGNLNINATTSFNLVSNGSQTAVMGPSSASATITGATKFNAQRFISARSAGYSDMAGSIQGQTLSDWELLLVYTYSPPYAYPSVFGYSESSFDYVPITSASQALTPGRGFEVYLDSDGSQTTFNNTTLINTGSPNRGTFNISSSITFNNDGWNLVGNPYHANLSWDALHATTTAISPDIMFYDETVEDFITVSTGSGALIAPNQGFWINITGGGHNFAFTEATKSTSTSSNFRNTPEQLFTLRLKSVGGTRFTSGTAFRFALDPATAFKGDLPFKGIPSPEAPTLASVSAKGHPLKINLLNSNQDEITVPLLFSVGQDGLYTIEAQNLESMQFEGYTCALLVDNKLGKTIDLASETYQFYATSGEGENRFSLKLVKNSDCSKQPIAVANGRVDINRLGDNTVVKLHFDEETTANITVTDLLGQPILPAQQVTGTEQTVTMAMPQHFTGIYLVNVFYGNKVESKKLFR